MPDTAVDQHQIRPFARDTDIFLHLVRILFFRAFSCGLGLHQAGKAAAQDFTHHAVIISGSEVIALDIELAVSVFLKPFRPGHDHRADRVRAHGMAVVIDFDAPGRTIQGEQLGHVLQQAALAGAFRQAPGQGFTGIGFGMFDQFPPLAAFGMAQTDLALRLDTQRLGDQVMGFRPFVEQDLFRWRLVVIKLPHEGAQNLGRGPFLTMAGKIGPVAPILPSPEEEDLDAALPAFHMDGDDVGLGHAGHIDALMGLDMGQGAQAVAIDGSGLECQRVRGGRHFLRQAMLDLLAAPGKEISRLRHQFGITVLVDAVHTGPGTTSDLIL